MLKINSKPSLRTTPIILTPTALALAACGGGGGGGEGNSGNLNQNSGYRLIPNFGVSNPASLGIEVYSEKGSIVFDASQITSSENRVDFKNFNFSSNEIRLVDLDGDGALTVQVYTGIEQFNEMTDVVVFESEGEVYNFVSDYNSTDQVFYLIAKDTGNIFFHEIQGASASINLIIEMNKEITGISVDGLSGPTDLVLSLSDTPDIIEDLVISGVTGDSFFSNLYTLTIADIPARFLIISEQLAQVGKEVIDNISNYIEWQGTLDFAIQFDDRGSFGVNGFFSTDDLGPGMPSLPFDAGNGYLVSHYEALFGIDLNGSEFDLGTNLLPDSAGNLTNYGFPIYINSSQNPSDDSEVPTGYHDFFSVFTHEILHAMGVMAVTWGTQINNLIEVQDGEQFYIGQNVVDLVGGPVPFENGHFGQLPNGTRGGLMHEFGYYDGRWEFGQFELAVFEDLGYNVNNPIGLPILDVDHVPLV